jgi:hypothetical protein
MIRREDTPNMSWRSAYDTMYLGASGSEGVEQYVRDMSIPSRSSTSRRMTMASSILGSGGVGAGYPSRGNNIFSRRSTKRSDVEGVKRYILIKCGKILESA